MKNSTKIARGSFIAGHAGACAMACVGVATGGVGLIPAVGLVAVSGLTLNSVCNAMSDADDASDAFDNE